MIINISDLLNIPLELTLVRQLPSGSLTGWSQLVGKSLRKLRLCGSGEAVMAKVIDFYVPKRFRKVLRVVQPLKGNVIAFCSREGKVVPTRPQGGVIQWPLEATEFTAVGDPFSHISLEREKRDVGERDVD